MKLLPCCLGLFHLALTSGAALPNASELPATAALPDPLVMLDGRRVTTPEMWRKERRPELLRLVQHYMYGEMPPRPENFSATLEREDANAFDGKAVVQEVVLQFGSQKVPPIYLMLVLPKGATAPVILQINYFGNHTLLRDPKVRLNPNWMPERGQGVLANRSTEDSRGSWVDIWRIEDVISRGYGVATFYNGDVDPDDPDQRGLQKHLTVLRGNSANPPGTIAAWAWGLMRAMDYLVAAPGVDAKRIVVTGHSRMGKAALLAAAFDERIALCIPHQAGCGGSAPSRAEVALGQPFNTLDQPTTRRPETVKLINKAFPHWFNATFKTFDDVPDRLPFDQNGLVALCAPRPVLFTNGRSDTWINPAGQFAVIKAAAPVYQLLGAGGFPAAELPADGETVGDGKLGYFLRAGGHSMTREDWKAFLDFADRQLGRP